MLSCIVSLNGNVLVFYVSASGFYFSVFPVVCLCFVIPEHGHRLGVELSTRIYLSRFRLSLFLQKKGKVAMTSVMNAEDIDTEFLPLIYDVIRSIEKDVHDSTQKIRDSHDTYQKVMELKGKFQLCKEQIQKLNAIDCNREEQMRRLDALRKQLKMKKELLLKYHNMCHFDTPK